VGGPTNRPPAQNEEPRSDKPSWIASQPAPPPFKDLLKSKQEAHSASNLFRPINNPDLGKWTKSSPLFTPITKPASTAQSAIFSPIPTIPRRPIRPSLNISPIVEDIKQQKALEADLPPPKWSSKPKSPEEIAEEALLKSDDVRTTGPSQQLRKFDKLESELLSGIRDMEYDIRHNGERTAYHARPRATTTKPQVNPSQSFMGSAAPLNIGATEAVGLRLPSTSRLRSGFPTEGPSPSKKFIDVPSSRERIAEAKPVSAAPELGFMKARRLQEAQRQPQTAKQSNRKQQHPDVVPLAEDHTLTVDSSSWGSRSRETWSYRRDLIEERQQVEQEIEEQIQAEEEKTGLTREEMAMNEFEKMEELEKTKAKAKQARFKVGFSRLALWKDQDQQRVEAPVQISVSRSLYIPPSVSVSNFAHILSVPMGITFSFGINYSGIAKEDGATWAD
jgi:hypothetical protein